MKDPHWHKSKHDCEEDQSLWIFINGEEDQPLCIHTKSCSCVITAWSNQLTEVLELPLEREDMAAE